MRERSEERESHRRKRKKLGRKETHHHELKRSIEKIFLKILFSSNLSIVGVHEKTHSLEIKAH